MLKILLVEDYEEKAKNIKIFLNTEFPFMDVEWRTSYNSAEYALILLDMSMSTYDLTADASGGQPEPSAGQYILEGMFLRNIPTPVIVVTMYNVFGRKELSAFDEELKSKYPQNYKSYVFYSSQKSDWKEHLKRQIKTILL